MNQQREFLSDKSDTVRDPHLYLSPEAERLCAWFSSTMRLTTLIQTAKGLPATTRPEVLPERGYEHQHRLMRPAVPGPSPTPA
jgi:hypothetical protein